MRTPVVAGNWKMNGDIGSAEELLADLKAGLSANAPKCEIVVCPPFTLLQHVGKILNKNNLIKIILSCLFIFFASSSFAQSLEGGLPALNIIEQPNGPTSIGTCKFCNNTKEFRNSMPGSGCDRNGQTKK